MMFLGGAGEPDYQHMRVGVADGRRHRSTQVLAN